MPSRHAMQFDYKYAEGITQGYLPSAPIDALFTGDPFINRIRKFGSAD
jgi:hypothetical protein